MLKIWTYSVVEKLLELLVGVIDTQLFEAVEAKDFEASNVEDADEASSLALGPVQWAVDPVHDPLEQPFESGLGDGFDGELDLLLGLSLGDVVPANLDPGPEEGLDHVIDWDAQQMGHFLRHSVVRQDRLIRVTFLLEDHVSEEQDTGDDLADGRDLVLAHPHDVHGLHGALELFRIVLAGDGHVAVTQERVVLWVFQNELLCKTEL